MKLAKKLAPLYLLLMTVIISAVILADQAVTALAKTDGHFPSHIFIIDAGHGGIDGGATSCTGVLESQLNLEIALRLNDLMHLMGRETVMIRSTDKSIYTAGNSIAAQKVSDLKERVRIVNETENGILVSIHQNIFADSKYAGAQVFYAKDPDSKEIAGKLQQMLIASLNPGSNRKSKRSDGIYLMEHIERPGILVECGFLSNIEEEAKLRSAGYQQRLCTVIAACLSSHFREGE